MQGGSGKRAACAAMLAALSLLALLLPWEADFTLDHALAPQGGVWALAAAAAALLFWRAGRRPLARGNRRLLPLAAFFALWVTLSVSFARHGDARLCTGQPLQALIMWLGRTALYDAAMVCLAERMSAAASRAALNATPRPSPRAAFWLAFGVMLLGYLPYYVAVFPGVVTQDAVAQIAQVTGLSPLANDHPLAQTLLLGLLPALGGLIGDTASLATACAAQLLLTCWALAACVRLLRELNALRGLLLTLTLLYALCPVYASYAQVIVKDTPFSLAVLWLSLCLWRMARAQEAPGRGMWAQLLGSALLVTLLRNAGVLVAAGSLLAALIWTLVRRRAGWRALTATALAASLAAYAALHLLLPVAGVADTPARENDSVQLQQIARIVVAYEGELSAEERATIGRVLDYEQIRAKYNPELSDPVKWLWRADATADDRTALMRLWTKLLRRYPASCFTATFANTYGYLYPGYVSSYLKQHYYLDPPPEMADIEAVYAPGVSANARGLSIALDDAMQSTLYRLLVSPGTYAWLLLFAAVLCCRRGARAYLLGMLPALLVLAGLFATAVNGYFRYALPVYLCAPICLALAAVAGRGVDAERAGAEEVFRRG